jgi:hypothetical protein
LERSVQAYQEERDRLESAYRRLTSSLRALDMGADLHADRPSPRYGRAKNTPPEVPAAGRGAGSSSPATDYE